MLSDALIIYRCNEEATTEQPNNNRTTTEQQPNNNNNKKTGKKANGRFDPASNIRANKEGRE